MLLSIENLKGNIKTENYIIYDFEQKSPEWHKFRKFKVSCSNLWKLYDMYGYNYEKYADEIENCTHVPINEHMLRGIEHEPDAEKSMIRVAKRNKKLSALKILHAGVIQSVSHPYFCGSPDAITEFHYSDGKIVLGDAEYKCPAKLYYGIFSGEMKKSHELQMTGISGLLNFERSRKDYVNWTNKRAVVLTFSIDTVLSTKLTVREQYQDILERLEEFHEEYICSILERKRA